MIPGLEGRLLASSEEEVRLIADLARMLCVIAVVELTYIPADSKGCLQCSI